MLTGPGLIVFSRMPRVSSSLATVGVSPASAALLAAYATSPGMGPPFCPEVIQNTRPVWNSSNGPVVCCRTPGGVGLADFVDTQFEFYGRPSTRETMDAAELERLAQEGRAMTLDESVASALESSIDELAPHDHAGVAR